MRVTELINSMRQEAVGTAPVYDVPEGYFDNFPTHLMNLIEQRQRTIRHRRWAIGSIAASLLPLAFAYMLLHPAKDEYSELMDGISEAEYEMAYDYVGINDKTLQVYLMEE